MTQALVQADSASTLTITANTVFFALPGATTGTGAANSVQVLASAMKTYFEGGVASEFVSTTPIATPSAYVVTTFSGFASTVSGAVLMGFGTTGDVTLKNQAGTDVLYITANTTGVVMAGAVTVGDAITSTGSNAVPAGTVRYMGGQNTGAIDLVNNVPTGGAHRFRVNGSTMLTVNTAITVGAAGAAFTVTGSTVALAADVASGALTYSGNVGTGTGSVGGIVFKVPVTHVTDSIAQTQTTVLTLGATTEPSVTIVGKIAASVTQKASVATSPGTAADGWTFVTGQGGNTTIATTGTGGKGGGWSVTTGAGGTAAVAVTAGTGGAGGDYALTTGAGAASAVTGTGTGTGGKGGAIAILTGIGGATSTSTGVNVGGASGAITLTTDAGGASTNGSSNTGGASGVITISTGAGGAGATAQGASGAISISTGATTATAGTITLNPGGLALVTASFTSATVGLVTIGGTYGAGVASMRYNGLTTAAVTNQTGTLLNAPVAGNPTFWMPVSVAGVIKYQPLW